MATRMFDIRAKLIEVEAVKGGLAKLTFERDGLPDIEISVPMSLARSMASSLYYTFHIDISRGTEPTDE